MLLCDNGVAFKLKKFKIFINTVCFLVMLTPWTLAVLQHIIDKILDLKPQRNITELQSFLGLCNDFRRFVPSFTRIATTLLNRKLQEDQSSHFEKLAQDELLGLQTLWQEPIPGPLLAFLRSAGVYILDIDACNWQAHFILIHQQPGEPDTPTGYCWISLKHAGRAYDTTHKKGLAADWAVLLLRPCTDSKSEPNMSRCAGF